MEAGKSSSFHPKVPHFFKVMLESNIRSGKLIIPKKFVRKYGTHLSKSDVVLLKVPTGDTWEVELKAINGMVQLEKGWREFMNFYSVEHGDFLVFRYDPGWSNELEAVLFNKTCTEVEYPKRPPVKVEDASEDDLTVKETRGHQPSRRMTRRRTTLISKGKVRSRSSSSRLDNLTTRTSKGRRDISVPEREQKVKSPSYSEAETRGPLKGSEKAEALERAKSFRSSKPYFAVVMQPYYVRPPYYHLNMPGRFLQRYLGQKSRGEMKLHVSGDKIWTVEYLIIAGGGRVTAKTSRSWKAFTMDNSLVVGDVCVFELIKGSRSISFKITIFRAPRIPSSRSSRLQAGRNNQKIAGCFELQPDPLFVSEYPFFQVITTKSDLSRGYLNMPTGFVRDRINLEGKERDATLKVGDRSWLVKLIIACPSKPTIRISCGFGAFLKENSLETGDMCSFELIDRAEIVFRVSITRANKAAKVLNEEEEE